MWFTYSTTGMECPVDVLMDVKDLNVEFFLRGRSLPAVENVNFKVLKGKTLCIVGESGCGKSVTVSAIMRLYNKQTAAITAGSVLFNGLDLVKCSDKEMLNVRGNEVSMIFQEPMTSLNPVYRIEDQMMESVLAHHTMDKKAAWNYCLEMLKEVKIPEPEKRMHEYPHQFSGGMRQRVMIAMALSCKPQLLIADEPTTALDVTTQAQILHLIKELKEKHNTSVILITHDMGVVAEVADYAIVMYAGHVVEYNSVEKLFENPLHPYTRGLLKAIPRFDRDVEELFTIPGSVPSLLNMPKGCRFADRCPYCEERCREQEPPQFDVGDGNVKCWRYEDVSKDA